jgi:WD40 repeat protein
VSFLRDVAPILMSQCQQCHGPEKQKGKYRLDSFARMMKPGDSGEPSVTPGQPAKSQLYLLLTAKDDEDRMPQKADPLPAKQIEVIRRWIEGGAKFDGKDVNAPLASLVAAREHPNPPEVYKQAVPVTAIAYSPDGATIAVSGYREITLWSAAEGKLIGRIKGQPERTLGLCYSPDGKLLAAAGGIPGTMGEVRVIDLAKKDAGKVLERIADQMLAVRFSPDGSKIAAGGADNAIRVYDVASGKRELLIEQHADWVTDLAWSPDGTKIAAASRDKSARVFDAATGSVLAAYLGHEEIVFGIAWSDDGKNVFSAGRDRKVHEWPVATEPKAVGTITGFGAEPFRVVAMEGSLFVCAADGTVRQYKQVDRSLVREYPKAADWVYCLAVDAKNHRLAAGTYGGEVRVFDTESGKVMSEFVASPGLAKP